MLKLSFLSSEVGIPPLLLLLLKLSESPEDPQQHKNPKSNPAQAPADLTTITESESSTNSPSYIY
jgi:hypothetical protein